jgi:ABC-type molybdate transport system substrate-binding protein
MTEMMQMEDFPSALMVANSATQQYDKVAVATANQGADKKLQRGSAAIAVIYHTDMLREKLLKDSRKRMQ